MVLVIHVGKVELFIKTVTLAKPSVRGVTVRLVIEILLLMRNALCVTRSKRSGFATRLAKPSA
jgi:hypothetical protein